MKERKQIAAIVDYIKKGEKARGDFSMGVEIEHFILHNEDFKTVSYYGKDGIGETLKALKEKSYDSTVEGDHVLGLNLPGVDISTEPGSQFEVAVDNHRDIAALDKKYQDFMTEVLDLFEEKNQRVVYLGYHPVTKIDEITILPKKRYDYMFNYFKTKGRMAHNMMKGTCALQVVLDFSDEEDFKKKYRLANILSPVFYSLFDNAYLFEGQVYEEHNLREKIWENTDKDRSGIFELAFEEDLSYEKYAEKILHTPLIFTEEKGEQVYCGEKTLADYLDPDHPDEALIFHALSIVFPDVRVKRYLELRMMDSVPYPYNFSCIALIKGIFYNEENLNSCFEETKNITYKDAMDAKFNMRKYGMKGSYKDMPITQWGERILEKAEKGLPEEERKYLEPLKILMAENKNPRDHFKEIYESQGLEKAIDFVTLTKEKFNA